MINIMQIDGYKAVISFDPEINMFRGEFVELNGGADFYSDTVEGLLQEGKTSLRVFLDVCREKGIEPLAKKSGRFVLRLNPEVHQKAVIKAKAEGKSLNEWANGVLASAVAS
jgi:predicted HicB family RNase H-like nuclease